MQVSSRLYKWLILCAEFRTVGLRNYKQTASYTARHIRSFVNNESVMDTMWGGAVAEAAGPVHRFA
jgi:hypothetical protein